MNRSLHNTENPSNNGSDQAHSAWSSYARAAQQQATRPPTQTQPYTKNSHKPKEFNTNNYNTGSVKIPGVPSTESAIQFGSVNQSPQGGKTGDAPVIKDSPSASPVDSRANIRSNPKPEIPRSPRSTNDGRLFTQPYAPRRDLNQDYNQNRPYNKNYQQRQMGGYQQPQYPVYTQPSPQQQTIPIHHRSPNMSNYTKKSPHLPNSSPQPTWAASGQYYFPPPQYQVPAYIPPMAPTVKKSIPIINPDTGATIVTQDKPSTSPLPKEEKLPFFKIPPATSRRLNIVNPAMKETEELAAAEKKRKEEEEDEKERLEKERLKKEHLEKERLEKERLEKERLEQERLEQERIEQERIEQERLEQERLEQKRLEQERLEREEKERKDREEKERLEREEKEKAEREEKERLEREEKEKAEREEKEKAEREEKERLLVEERKKEEELKEIERTRIIRKAEEDELKRIAEQETKKKEGDRAVDVASQKIGRSPNPIDISPIPSYLNQSPVSSPIEIPRVVTRVLEDPSEVDYPPTVTAAPTKSKKELGKYVYETEFLLQFQALCLQTTADLSAMKELMETVNNKANSGMQRRQTSERNKSGRNQQNHAGGDAMYKMGSRDGGRMEMGKFNMGRPLTSRTASGYNEQLISGGSGRGGGNSSRGRGGMKVTRNPPQLQGAPTIPVEQVVPLEKSDNRWVPGSVSGTAPAVPEGDLVPKEIILKKVNSLLNKLTLEKFDSISQQIFDFANQSTKEEDGKSLRTVIRLMFEKACDEPAFAAMWARLARYIHDKISDDVIDVNIVGKDGNVVKGKALYRKYLLNRCQIEFEKGWKINMPEVKDGEMLTDEYYVAAKAKRQGLGLIAYIGEAYKMDMLSHKIMLGCFIRLCDDPSNISDEEAESLCKLIKTAGQKFDKNSVSHNWMEALIARIKNEMMFSPNLSSRIKFLLQDVLDLRKNNWVPRGGAAQAGPTTIAKIHEMAEKAIEEKESALKRGNSNRGNFIPNNNHNNNMSRTGSHRGGGNSGGGGREFQSFKPNYNNNNSNNNNNNNGGGGGGDGWNTVGTTSPGGPNKNRVSELSNFGKLDRSRSKSSTLSPGNSPFASLSKNKSFSENKESSEGRASPARNMFSALLGGRDEEKREDAPVPESAPQPEPKTEKLSDEAIHRKTKNILDEYFNIRDKTELSECVKELEDPHYKEIFVSEMLTVVEKKESDVEQMCDIINHLNGEGLLERSPTLDAFKTFMEGYDDLTIDVPQAHKYVAQLLIAFKLSPSDVGGEEFPSLEKAYNGLKDD